MGFFKRLLGICRTEQPADAKAWKVDNGRLVLDPARLPELTGGQGAVRLEGGGLDRRVLVVRDDEGGYHAFENKCSHAGRRLDHQTGQGRVQCCSIGKSVFDFDGVRQSGSAKGPVKVLPITLEGEKLVIELG
jgi:nitrite reductase/ring-hydroxylating ferredoxin subunit